MLSFPKLQLLDMCDAMVATTPFVGAVLHLSTTNFTPGKNTILADFTEATFTGYAASSAIVWGASHLDVNDNAVSVGSAKTFLQTGDTVTNIVFTWFVTTALGAYLMGGAFDTPLNFAEAGDGVTVIPTYLQSGS